LLIGLPSASVADEGVQVDTLDVGDTASVFESPVPADSIAVADTILFVPENEKLRATEVTNPVDLEQHLCQNPTTALFKSMFVPGLGQIGNGRYVKAGVFVALESWFIGAAIHYGRQAADFREEYEATAHPGLRDDYYRLYDDRRDQRNKYTWFAAITIFVSMFDAYVDAHLSGAPDEPRNEAIAVRVLPDSLGGASVALEIGF
jgi:hypothetical protein